MRIEACFDSHVHWLATGEFSGRLRLDSLRSASEISHLKVESAHWRGEWLVGFGWDDNKWSEPPTRQILDRVFPNQPVAFSRCDGHAMWVNSEALMRAGLLEGWPSGVLLDQKTAAVDRLIPRASGFELRRQLLKGVRTFNEAGFTHIRDMTCNEEQWNEAVRLDEAGLLTLAVEEYFWLKDHQHLESLLALAKRARAAQTPNLRVMGIKLFLDGALGSQGAWISACYKGSPSHGLRLWEAQALSETLPRIWAEGFAVAIHAIGDEASAWLIDLLRDLEAKGLRGPVHLEHAEILRPDTIEKMKGLALTCHLQPAHWLSDHHWLEQKIGGLAQHAFPWRRLQVAEIPFQFGSDSPIEPASVARTFEALQLSSEAGVPRLLGRPETHMTHSDLAWVPNSFSIFENFTPQQVVFRGENVI